MVPRSALVAAAWLASAAASTAQSIQPPLPYLDQGACPFECCTYRSWTAERSTTVLSERRRGARKAFDLEPGEKVAALTGLVETTAAGVVRVHEAVTVGDTGHRVELRPGDEVFMLHYQGEGFGLFWFRGKTFTDQFWGSELGFVNGRRIFEILALPEVTWWVQIRNAKGETGWSEHPEDYDGADQCS